MSTWKKYFKSILTGVLLFAFLITPVNFKAEEFTAYPVDLITKTMNIRYGTSGSFAVHNGGNLTNGVFTMQYGFRLDKERLNGDSVLDIGFNIGTNGRTINSVKVQYANIFSSDWKLCQVVDAPYFTVGKINDCLYGIQSYDIEMDWTRDDEVWYIVIVVEHDITLSSGGIVALSDLHLNYYEPPIDYMNDVLNPSPEDDAVVDEFKDDISDKSTELDNLIADMDSLNKPGADSFNTDLSGVVSNDDIGAYSMVLATVTESKLVFSLMVIVFTIGLVGYALFGKRG